MCPKTIAILVNYTCKSFIDFDPRGKKYCSLSTRVHRPSSDYKLENIRNRSFALVSHVISFLTIRLGVMILAGAERAY